MKKLVLIVSLLAGALFAQRYFAAEKELNRALQNFDVEIEDDPDKKAPPLIFTRPARLGYASSAVAVRTPGLNLLIKYPSFRPPTPADRQCTDKCEAQILISIAYSPSSKKKAEHRRQRRPHGEGLSGA